MPRIVVRDLYSRLGGKKVGASALVPRLRSLKVPHNSNRIHVLSPGVQEKYVCRAGEIRFQDGTIYFSSSRDLICSEPTVLRETAFTHQLLSNLEKRTSHDRNSIDFCQLSWQHAALEKEFWNHWENSKQQESVHQDIDTSWLLKSSFVETRSAARPACCDASASRACRPRYFCWIRPSGIPWNSYARLSHSSAALNSQEPWTVCINLCNIFVMENFWLRVDVGNRWRAGVLARKCFDERCGSSVLPWVKYGEIQGVTSDVTWWHGPVWTWGFFAVHTILVYPQNVNLMD